jgi:hypothetical protein
MAFSNHSNRHTGPTLSMPDIVLWLFVLILGTSFGGALYEARVMVPLWTRTVTGAFQWAADLSRRADAGRRFWAFVTTGPLTLLAVASMLLAGQAASGQREWWMTAASVIIVERIATFAYFIPAILRLQRAPPGDRAVNSAASRWIALNYFRITFLFIGWVAALRALTL